MVYSGNKNNNYYYNSNGRQSNYRREEDNLIKKIEKPLHLYYEKKAEVLLPDGKASKYACDFRSIPNYQLRKILSLVKKCKALIGKENFEKIRNQLFFIVPMAAYNAGRDKKLLTLYNFLNEHINEQSIQSEEDIKTFDELFTSIIAYHSYNSKNQRG